MKHLIEKCSVIIFDLDGTLYEGTSHFDYYAEQIKQELAEELREDFDKDYTAIKQGNHALKIGTVYDMEKDTVLTLDPMTLSVMEAHTWEGQLVSTTDVTQWYNEPIVYDETRMIAVGDGWWLPYVTGAHYGVKDTYHCYDKTKEYMVSKEFVLPKTEGLKEALTTLKDEKKLVLMTNSDYDDVQRLLKELELEGLFDFEITDAYKPFETEQHLQKLMILYSVEPHEVVSIGDNFINEIAPALKIGMHAIYISSHGHPYSNDSLVIVPTLANAF
jgi:FMN phosphatase YigB (HAD superfamily)